MRIRTVFFDLGGTLAEQITDPVDVWIELSDRFRFGASRAAIKRALDETSEWFQTAVYDALGRMDEFWIEYDRRILRSLGVPDPEGLAPRVQERFRSIVWSRAYPESRDILAGLRVRGYALGVISNATEEIVGRIRTLGFAEYLETITYSQEARTDKPDPAIFRLALGRAKCAPEEAVHIGNTYEQDVVGARATGIRPILVDRKDEHPGVDCPRVRDLRGVPGLLERERS